MHYVAWECLQMGVAAKGLNLMQLSSQFLWHGLALKYSLDLTLNLTLID